MTRPTHPDSGPAKPPRPTVQALAAQYATVLVELRTLAIASERRSAALALDLETLVRKLDEFRLRTTGPITGFGIGIVCGFVLAYALHV